MKTIARRITADAMAIEDKDRAGGARPARRGESSHAIAGALTLAGTEEGSSVTPDDLDADPFLLNCANGTLDLRTGELRGARPGRPADEDGRRRVRTRTRPARSSPSSWSRVQPDPAMRAYLARLLGHALEGRVIEHVLPIFHGDGANGKSTLRSSAVLAALGDYADAGRPGAADRPHVRRAPDRHRRPVRAAAGRAARVRPGPAPRRGHRQAADRRRPDQGPADARGLLVLRPVAHVR